MQGIQSYLGCYYPKAKNKQGAKGHPPGLPSRDDALLLQQRRSFPVCSTAHLRLFVRIRVSFGLLAPPDCLAQTTIKMRMVPSFQLLYYHCL